jgi:hypothetical protein
VALAARGQHWGQATGHRQQAPRYDFTDSRQQLSTLNTASSSSSTRGVDSSSSSSTPHGPAVCRALVCTYHSRQQQT